MRNYNQYLEILFQVKKDTEVKVFATICFEGFFFKLQLSNEPNKNGVIMQNKFSIILIENIAKNVAYDQKSCSAYRDRLIKRGLIIANERGKVSLTLPRFDIFIAKQQ